MEIMIINIVITNIICAKHTIDYAFAYMFSAIRILIPV